MSPNYQRYEFRMNSMRRKSILLLMLSAVNVSGCHNGSTRSVQRPRIFSNPFRRQAIVVNPGIEAVETPGAVVVEQQQGAVTATQTAEPGVTTLQPRQGGSVTSVVPSFDDAQQPIGSGVKSNLDATRTNPSANDAKSIMNSLAPPAEAPQVIMEAPPLGAGSGGKSSSPSLSAPIDSSTSRAGSQSQGQDEPRLEAIEPRKGSSTPGGSSSPSTKSSTNGTPKTSWRNQPKFGDVSGRTTYQASTRRSKTSDGTELGELD